MQARVKRANGWIPDLPDHRDLYYREMRKPSLFRAALRPSVVDLSSGPTAPNFPAIFDQGQVGSCVGNGVSRVCGYAEGKEGNGAEIFSRLFIYYNARKADGTTAQDAGTTIRGGIKAVASYGACLEVPFWPYDETKWSVEPSKEAYDEGAHRKVDLQYARLASKGDILDCIAGGFPVVFGTILFEQFQGLNPKHCTVHMPTQHDTPIGGHCMVIVGYDTKKKLFKVANSWGTGWGLNGYCFFPFAYLLNPNLADDFWTVRQIAK